MNICSYQVIAIMDERFTYIKNAILLSKQCTHSFNTYLLISYSVVANNRDSLTRCLIYKNITAYLWINVLFISNHVTA